jgi:hypothetical protein
VRRHRRRPTGQALAEFAIVFPLFILSVLILIDFARAIFVYSVISDAAREGTRYAIVHGVLAAGDNPPVTGPGTADPNGSTYVAPQAKAIAFGLDQSLLRVGVCWGYRCTIPPDCSTGTNTAVGPVPDVPVTVRTCYDFTAITASFLRQGTISLSAESTLTVTH